MTDPKNSDVAKAAQQALEEHPILSKLGALPALTQGNLAEAAIEKWPAGGAKPVKAPDKTR